MSERDFALEVHGADSFEFVGAGEDLPDTTDREAVDAGESDADPETTPLEPSAQRLTVEVLTSFQGRAMLEAVDIEGRMSAAPAPALASVRLETDTAAPSAIPALSDSDDKVTAQYMSGSVDRSGYNIEVLFLGEWAEPLKDAFVQASEWLSAVVLSDLPDAWLGGDLIDDVRIEVRLSDIDGEGGILGRAEPYFTRAFSGLPIAGEMEFDRADAESYDAQGQFDDIVLHEMFHVLGFGTTWTYLDLTAGRTGDGDLRFVGPMASAYFVEEMGGSPGGVPIEENGGAETAGYHWDEDEFTIELMTGYIDNPNTISNVTIASLEDIGYDTVLDDPDSETDLYGVVPEVGFA